MAAVGDALMSERCRNHSTCDVKKMTICRFVDGSAVEKSAMK